MVLLFTIEVDNEYTAKMMAKAAKKLKIQMEWQWVKVGKGKVIVCDYFSKE